MICFYYNVYDCYTFIKGDLLTYLLTYILKYYINWRHTTKN